MGLIPPTATKPSIVTVACVHSFRISQMCMQDQKAHCAWVKITGIYGDRISLNMHIWHSQFQPAGGTVVSISHVYVSTLICF